jgi:hypothetical protein
MASRFTFVRHTTMASRRMQVEAMLFFEGEWAGRGADREVR